jgi:hypothetical protein
MLHSKYVPKDTIIAMYETYKSFSSYRYIVFLSKTFATVMTTDSEVFFRKNGIFLILE